jgi:hypothetical protein
MRSCAQYIHLIYSGIFMSVNLSIRPSVRFISEIAVQTLMKFGIGIYTESFIRSSILVHIGRI